MRVHDTVYLMNHAENSTFTCCVYQKCCQVPTLTDEISDRKVSKQDISTATKVINKLKSVKRTLPHPGIEPGAARLFSFLKMKASYVNPYTNADWMLMKDMIVFAYM
jgi:hypothetical protein